MEKNIFANVTLKNVVILGHKIFKKEHFILSRLQFEIVTLISYHSLGFILFSMSATYFHIKHLNYDPKNFTQPNSV